MLLFHISDLLLALLDALAARCELLSPVHSLAHVSSFVRESKVLFQKVLSSQSCGYGLDLFLGYLLGLSMQKVIHFQLQVILPS